MNKMVRKGLKDVEDTDSDEVESSDSESSEIESVSESEIETSKSSSNSSKNTEFDETDDDNEEEDPSKVDNNSNSNFVENEAETTSEKSKGEPNNSSSYYEDEDESKIEQSENETTTEKSKHELQNNSSIEVNNDDSDDDIPIRSKGKKINRLESDDDDDDEEDEDEIVLERRKTLYAIEPEGDLSTPVEDLGFSRSTRRSIHGFSPRQTHVKSEIYSDVREESEDDSDSDVIICDSDSDDDANNEPNEKENENLDYSGMIEKKLSSTIRSPLKIKTENVERNSFDNSIGSQLSSTINVKNEPDSPLSSSIDTSTKQNVSKSVYERILAEKEALSNRLQTLNMIMKNDNGLPDGGKKLHIAIQKIKKELEEKENSIKSLAIDESQNESIKSQIMQSIKSENESSSSFRDSTSEGAAALAVVEKEIPAKQQPINYLNAEDVQPRYTGKIGLKHFNEQKALTVETLQDIQKTLDQRPSDEAVETPPKYLKIELMRHQLHALAFMIWRENQKPRGGILADDMGLGKTLTVISLIMKQLQKEEDDDEEEDDDSDEDEKAEEDAWIARGHKSLRRGGTLVICPASLMNQWEQEIKTKIKRGALEVNVFHGSKRIVRAKDLQKFDVVITTYQIILSEHKNDGCIFGVKWDRIVLDEGHIIRNYRSKQSEAVCALLGKRRWVLTGTPIQNKEFDLYAAIKFLRCSPFDDLRYWRQWIEIKGGGCSQRLQTLLKSILIRRTKQQLQESGEINSLPEKSYELFHVKLNGEERKVYNRFMALSQAIFAQFLAQQEEKNDLYSYDKTKLHKLHQKFAKINRVDRDVKAHEILTLLLRLRQICCHPGLVKKAIESSEIENGQLENELDASANESDTDILKQLQNLKISNEDGSDNPDIAPISVDDEVFNMDIPSSKTDKLMEIIREKLHESEDKAIIVSQWVSFLDIIKAMLEIEGIDYVELNGKVPVKYRNDIVVDFNRASSSKRVMLLSITAGGVGLNLVGANLLFIMDPHWNPQIESQAQDRIYRFGQKKNVKVMKFICEDTIEEKILKIQQNKLDIATSALTGAKRNATKLTIDDLKQLFGINT